MKTRSSGILMHISSLPGRYGIGDFGQGAYDFVDFLVRAKQRYWQILPLGITGYGDSPYQSFSAFAGNPYFIDLDELINLGYLGPKDIKGSGLNNNPDKVDYNLLYKNKMELLRRAYNEGKEDLYEDLNQFFCDNYNWLREFVLFMSIKTKYKGASWQEWDMAYKDSKSDTVINFENDIKNRNEIYFWTFTQYFFFKQWHRLRKYANKKGVYIIGDLPIYVAEDSADVWANTEIFNLDDKLCPITVAGAPPDDCSVTGQLWGNPVYNWDVVEKRDYRWWVQRVKIAFDHFDALRIDHFRGFESYCEIDYGAKEVTDWKWVKGPGIKLFDAIKEKLGDLNIIAEDLGFITQEVEQLIEETGFPSMKVLQFAFNHKEDSNYLPHNYNKNCVVYTGTHDNPTIMGFIRDMPAKDFEYARKYLKLNKEEGYNWGFIRGAWSSTAYLAIAPMQDILGLDDRARMNIPSTASGNWTWRMNRDDLTEELAEKIKEITNIYRR